MYSAHHTHSLYLSLAHKIYWRGNIPLLNTLTVRAWDIGGETPALMVRARDIGGETPAFLPPCEWYTFIICKSSPDVNNSV